MQKGQRTKKTVAINGLGRISKLTHVWDTLQSPSVGKVILIDPAEGVAQAIVAEYAGRTSVELAVAQDISQVDEPVDGVIVAAIPSEHHRIAMDSIERLRACVKLEKGGKTLPQMLDIVQAGDRAGVHVQGTFHHLLAAKRPFNALAAGGFAPAIERPWTARFDWLRKGPSSHNGAFDDLTQHGIADVVAAGAWVMPDSVIADRPEDDTYVILLEWDAAPLRTAVIRVGGSVVQNIEERVELRLSSETADFRATFPTMMTPRRVGWAGLMGDVPPDVWAIDTVENTRAEQSRLWISSLSEGRPLLPAYGWRLVVVQAIFDAARDSLDRGGVMVRPRTDWV